VVRFARMVRLHKTFNAYEKSGREVDVVSFIHTLRCPVLRPLGKAISAYTHETPLHSQPCSSRERPKKAKTVTFKKPLDETTVEKGALSPLIALSIDESTCLFLRSKRGPLSLSELLRLGRWPVSGVLSPLIAIGLPIKESACLLRGKSD
jgi:hypothetical protein